MSAMSSAAEVRQRCRRGELTGPTAGLAPSRVQANLVVLPQALAYDFLLFCQRNPQACPVLEVMEAGDPEPRLLASGADLRTDLPRYRVFRDGELVAEPAAIDSYWRDDLVGFLLGCSFTFEAAMIAAGLPVRHLELACNVPMYRTEVPCLSAGPFRGPLVVTMRPLTPAQAIRAVRITGRYPRVHGAPVHLGDPAGLGIGDLSRPDWGDAVTIRDGEIPVFWACGVTSQAAIAEARPELAVTHAPGCMLVTDVRNEELAS
ncbi:MAG: putative hydro-lyase [bacterium]|nr:putative hydro-lyase [bacterium]